MDSQQITLPEALKALHALRTEAGLAPEMFPMAAFVGMISDEIEALRKLGRSDEEIAEVIEENSAITITPAEISEHYATESERGKGDQADRA